MYARRVPHAILDLLFVYPFSWPQLKDYVEGSEGIWRLEHGNWFF